MNKIILKIDGMHCTGCSTRLENILKNKEKIKSAKVDFNNKKAEIEYEEISKKDIEEYIEDAGFKPLGEINEKSSS